MTDGVPKAARIVTGILLMAAFVMILWAVLTTFAGRWGVPYFSFQTERGSTCRNQLTGYTCQPVTLADVQFYGDVTLPDSTTVVASRYRATHDYQLDGQLVVPPADAATALAALQDSFGPCRPGLPAPMPTAGLSAVCVLANDDASISGDSDVSSRLYAVGTGLRRDGSRVIAMNIRSR
ncbi:MAG TPA: hypothetical protein VEQ66_16690 [Propionibacteriaceae bacterium]|nr:hypothetical protein [Propionibacteriaceae bacterium]